MSAVKLTLRAGRAKVGLDILANFGNDSFEFCTLYFIIDI
jgi:hypothetical protein